MPEIPTTAKKIGGPNARPKPGVERDPKSRNPNDAKATNPKGNESDKHEENRGMGEKLAESAMGVASTVAEKAKDAAVLTAEGGTNMALKTGTSIFRQYLEDNLGHILRQFGRFPILGDMVMGSIASIIYPSYLQVNPETKISLENFTELLKRGHVDSLGDDIYPVFTNYLAKHLSEEDQAKLQAGSNLIMIKAFNKALYAKAVETVDTAKKPGGIKRICKRIANWIPIVNRAPEGAKPWIGGIIGVWGASIIIKLAWRLAKGVLALLATITGFKFLSNKLGGPPPGLPPELANQGEEGQDGGGFKGMLAKAGQLAQQAAQAQAGMPPGLGR